MNCYRLWVGTVKKDFCPAVRIWVILGVVGSVLQRKLIDLVKMSAWKKTDGFILGVVIVKESIVLRVELIKMVEQVVFAFLGRANLVTP